MTPPRLYLSHDADFDWLIAVEFGRVDEGQPPDCWRGVTDRFGFLHDGVDGPVVGFKVLGFSTFEPEDPAVAEIWDEPRFDAPTLGLANVPAGEVVLAARTHFGGRDSINRQYFGAATGATGEEALDLWRACLQAGDSMAHFALGYTLFELGRFLEAYRHLRHYTEIAPHGAWQWHWFGQAAEAVGEVVEARRAYRRAIELEESGEEETDAAARLARLDATAGDRHSYRDLMLWGDELPNLGQRRVEALSRDVALGLTAGEKPKSYHHVDPNEDAVGAFLSDEGTLAVCADGHNGFASVRLALDGLLDGPPTTFADLGDVGIVDRWHAANEAILAGTRGGPQPESRTTLVLAFLSHGRLRWASMGDSLIAVISPDGTVTRLGAPRSHFVGYPMTRGEVDSRLQRGFENLEPGSWVALATDGFTDFVRDVSVALQRAVSEPVSAARAVDRVIDAAVDGGAGDNVAAVLLRVPGPETVTARMDGEVSFAARVRGSLFAGAVGDALGAPVEFDSIATIQRRFGPDGVAELAPAYGRVGAITDDTQMTLFTAEGLLRAYTRGMAKGIAPDVVACVDHAYARWLATQGAHSQRWDEATHDGLLFGARALHAQRAPGKTCLAALQAARRGSLDAPLNDSKGCGGVMRIAPVGLLGQEDRFGSRFELGGKLAALTHGHPSGYLAAGALAELIGSICDGSTLEQALDHVDGELVEWRGHEMTSMALRLARSLAQGVDEPGPEVVAQLGAGWVAEEALAISVYCALVASDLEHGLRLAVNHSGDTDSTGAITGNILGALWGERAIPVRWIEKLEVGDVLDVVCRDWIAAFGGGNDLDVEDPAWWERYPGW